MRKLMAAVLAGLALAAPAHADRKPTDRERTKIAAVLDRAGFSCDIFPGEPCSRTIRVSTVKERWAAGYIHGHGGPLVQDTPAGLKRKNHRWRVRQIGNGGGCDMPSAVRRDLHLQCY